MITVKISNIKKFLFFILIIILSGSINFANAQPLGTFTFPPNPSIFPGPVTFLGTVTGAGSTNPLCTTTPESNGAVGDGVTNDLPAFNTTFTNTPIGGTICLSNKVYRLNGTWVINKSISVRGTGIHALWGSAALPNGLTIPFFAPYISGSVLLEGNTNTDAILINSAGDTINFFDFGIKFNTLFATTGNGITVNPPALLTYQDNGIMSSTWQRIMVYGHDGNHYAFSVINPQHEDFEDLFAFGGGGMYLANNSIYNYGNTYMANQYFVVGTSGTAHAVRFERTGGAVGRLNLITCVRCQTFVMDVSQFGGSQITGGPPLSTQKMFSWSTSNVKEIAWVAPDWETNVASTADTLDPSYNSSGYVYQFAFGGPNSVGLLGSDAGISFLKRPLDAQQLNFSNGTANNVPTFLVSDIIGAAGSGFLPSLAAGSANGGSPPAPVVGNSTDERGLITFGSGTAPSAGQQVVVTFGVTYAASVHISVVLTPNNAATQALGLYVCAAPGQSSWTVCSANAPTASQTNTTYSFSYILFG